MVFKSDIKVLRFVSRKKPVTLGMLYKKFDKSDVDRLCPEHIYLNYLRKTDADGFPIEDYPLSTICTLTGEGRMEKEAHDWFDPEYVIRSIIIPIIIGLSSSIISWFLIGFIH